MFGLLVTDVCPITVSVFLFINSYSKNVFVYSFSVLSKKIFCMFRKLYTLSTRGGIWYLLYSGFLHIYGKFIINQDADQLRIHVVHVLYQLQFWHLFIKLNFLQHTQCSQLRYRYQALTALIRIHRYLIRMNNLYTAYACVFLKALLITSLNPQKKQSNDLTNSQNARNNTWITFLQPIWTSEVNINYMCKRDKFQKAFVFIPK